MSLAAFYSFLVEQVEHCDALAEHPKTPEDLRASVPEAKRQLQGTLECLETWMATYRHLLCEHCNP